MTDFACVIEAMALPVSARVDQRIPKKLLVENGAPTAADRRQVNEAIEELSWVAALKPNNIGVPAFKDAARDYLEVAILCVAFRTGANATRLTELIHRAIPYPVVLWAGQGESLAFSVAHKRRSQAEIDAVVVEEVFRSPGFRPAEARAAEKAFLSSLALSRLPQRDLCALYQGYIDRVEALLASVVTAEYRLPETAAQALTRHDALAASVRIQKELAALRRQAAREKQLSRRVDLNLAIKRLESSLASATANL